MKKGSGVKMNLLVSEKLIDKGVSHKLAGELTDFVSQRHDFEEEIDLYLMLKRRKHLRDIKGIENAIISSPSCRWRVR